MFGGVGAVPGAIGGAVIGGALALLGKTAPQVQNIAMNAKDTASQLGDLLKAIPADQAAGADGVVGASAGPVEHSFIEQFIVEVNKLEQLATSFDGLISSLTANTSAPQQADASSAAQLTSSFKDEIGLVGGCIMKFRAKVLTGVYKSFVNHSKIMAPVYLFIDDDVEDVEKSCQSLEAAIKEHTEAMSKVRSAASGSQAVTQNTPDKPNDKDPQTKTDQAPISTQTKGISNILRELKITNPNPKQMQFLNDIMGGNQ